MLPGLLPAQAARAWFGSVKPKSQFRHWIGPGLGKHARHPVTTKLLLEHGVNHDMAGDMGE
jgi:hypothetical protein